MYDFLNSMTSKIKAMGVWLDDMPGFSAFGLGLLLGVLWPAAQIKTIVLIAVVFALLKYDIGGVGSKLANWLRR